MENRHPRWEFSGRLSTGFREKKMNIYAAFRPFPQIHSPYGFDGGNSFLLSLLPLPIATERSFQH
ncbi:hypothetical protein [Clostridium vitabionis]|uniref:hypothetical protein n=1 Tax=Clostridium vitabionis TaxID=2784388 RepID=UPI00188D2033|nr:hypothetical protein [Clostridium vitabionis]